MLIFVLAWVVVTRQIGTGWLRPALAGIVAVLGACAIVRWNALRTYLRILAIAPVVFALLFVGNSRIAPLVLSDPPSASATVVAHPKRVVMIVLDELPLESLLDGHGALDRELFPNLAALGTDATWYRNATTVAPFTPLAVPAIVTGNYPKHADAIPTATSYPNSLFTLLGRSYQMNVQEISAEQLCSASLCRERSNASFRSLLSEARKLWDGIVSTPKLGQFFDVDERNSAFPALDNFLTTLTPARTPRLDYIHVLLPHQPWNHTSTGQTYPDDDGALPGGDAAWKSQGFAEQAHQRHLLQLAAVDTYIGRITAKLKSLGVYDDSLVVLTADHGAAFTLGGDLRAPANVKNYPEILWVPLFIKTPGQHRGAINDTKARTIDILPTMADILGAKLPWKPDGSSLLGATRQNGPLRFADLVLQDAFIPPSDPNYRNYDGVAGFARVLHATPYARGGDPSLRLYGIGDWAQLVGTSVEILRLDPPSDRTYLITNGSDYLNVNPTAADAPWTLVRGGLSAPGRRFLMIAVNNKIAGFVHTSANYLGGDAFRTLVAPQLFQPGPNSIRIFAVTGTASRPRFAEVTAA